MSGNHNQSLARALEIVEAAAKTGAHGLKIQTYTPGTMTLDLNHGEFFISDPTVYGWVLRSINFMVWHTLLEWYRPIFERAGELGSSYSASVL